LDAIRPWITNKITELLGFEDDVLINFTFELLEGKDAKVSGERRGRGGEVRTKRLTPFLGTQESPNPKEMQHQLEGFLDKETPTFVKELWNLLLSAQAHPTGIPKLFLDQKKDELRQTRVTESVC